MKARKCDTAPKKKAFGGAMGAPAMDDMSMPPATLKPRKPMGPAPKPMPPMEGGIAKPRLDRMRKTRP